MKTIKFFFFGLILTLLSSTIFSQNVAVVYSSKVASTIPGAAATKIRYPSTTFYDIASLDSAATRTLILAISRNSLHKIYVITDSTALYSVNELQTFLIDSLAARLYTAETGGITPDAYVTRVKVSTTVSSKSEVQWASLFPSLAQPLIVEYMGYSKFSSARGIAKYASTDSTVIDSTQNWTDGLYDGQYVYIRSGAAIGEYRLIDSTYGTGEYVRTTVDFSVAPSLSTYVIKKSTQTEEFFYDIYSELFILTYLSDLSDDVIVANWRKLMDNGHNINTGTLYLTPLQDLDYLWNSVIAKGNIIFDYLKL